MLLDCGGSVAELASTNKVTKRSSIGSQANNWHCSGVGSLCLGFGALVSKAHKFPGLCDKDEFQENIGRLAIPFSTKDSISNLFHSLQTNVKNPHI